MKRHARRIAAVLFVLGMLLAAAAPASAAPGDSSPSGAQVSHECFEEADLCQHQVLTPSGHNNGYSYFTPSEPVGSPPAPARAQVIQSCEEEPGIPLERVCAHSTRTPSGNILSSFHTKPVE